MKVMLFISILFYWHVFKFSIIVMIHFNPKPRISAAQWVAPWVFSKTLLMTVMYASCPWASGSVCLDRWVTNSANNIIPILPRWRDWRSVRLGNLQPKVTQYKVSELYLEPASLPLGPSLNTNTTWMNTSLFNEQINKWVILHGLEEDIKLQ